MRSEWIFKDGEFLRGPWEVAHRDKIISVHKTDWAPKDTVILPGFINLHCHLELSNVDPAKGYQLNFAKWVQQLRQQTENWTLKDFCDSVTHGLQQLASSGVTSVVDVGNTLANWKAGQKSPIRLWAQREIFGLDPKLALERLAAAQLEFKEFKKTDLFDPNFTAHAAYSCSTELIEAIVDWRAKHENQLLLNIHVSESIDEQLFFKEASGPLREFSQQIYPKLNWEKCEGSAEHLFNLRPQLRNELWVHGNTIGRETLKKMAAQNVALVHCPQSRAYFEHPKPDLKMWSEEGVAWGLGTDSKASNFTLDFWDELYTVVQAGIRPEVALMKATKEGADILGRQDLGRLEADAWADFQIVKIKGDPNEWYKNKPEILEVYCQGKRVFKNEEL